MRHSLNTIHASNLNALLGWQLICMSFSLAMQTLASKVTLTDHKTLLATEIIQCLGMVPFGDLTIDEKERPTSEGM